MCYSACVSVLTYLCDINLDTAVSGYKYKHVNLDECINL